jgi:hypothetical protein
MKKILILMTIAILLILTAGTSVASEMGFEVFLPLVQNHPVNCDVDKTWNGEYCAPIPIPVCDIDKNWNGEYCAPYGGYDGTVAPTETMTPTNTPTPTVTP